MLREYARNMKHNFIKLIIILQDILIILQAGKTMHIKPPIHLHCPN